MTSFLVSEKIETISRISIKILLYRAAYQAHLIKSLIICNMNLLNFVYLKTKKIT